MASISMTTSNGVVSEHLILCNLTSAMGHWLRLIWFGLVYQAEYSILRLNLVKLLNLSGIHVVQAWFVYRFYPSSRNYSI